MNKIGPEQNIIASYHGADKHIDFKRNGTQIVAVQIVPNKRPFYPIDSRKSMTTTPCNMHTKRSKTARGRLTISGMILTSNLSPKSSISMICIWI